MLCNFPFPFDDLLSLRGIDSELQNNKQQPMVFHEKDMRKRVLIFGYIRATLQSRSSFIVYLSFESNETKRILHKWINIYGI